MRIRLVGLGALLCANTSCRVFRTRLEMGACHANASCMCWRLVMREYVLSCFSNVHEMGACHANASCRSWHLVGLGVLLCF